MEEDNPKDGWEEYKCCGQQAEIDLPPEVFACLSSLSSSQSRKKVGHNTPAFLFQAYYKTQGSHHAKKAARCSKPKKVEHIVVVVEARHGGDQNIDCCDDGKD